MYALEPHHSLTFLSQSTMHPIRSGAATTTAASSAEAFVDGAGVLDAHRVVELGAGTGAVTEALCARLPEHAELLAVEINPILARHLRRRCAGANVSVVCASALELRPLLAESGIDTADRVVCTVPTLAMETRDQESLLCGIRHILAPGGRLSVLLSAPVGVTPPGRRFRRLLSTYFEDCHASRILWTNVPPLRAYHCDTARGGKKTVSVAEEAA